MKFIACAVALVIPLAAATMAWAQPADDALSSDGGSWNPIDVSACSLSNITFVGGQEAILYFGNSSDPDGSAAYRLEGKLLATNGVGSISKDSQFIPKFLSGTLRNDGTLLVTYAFTTKALPDEQKREACVFRKDKS